LIGVYTAPEHGEVHLIEVRVEAPPADVDIGAFTQEVPGRPASDWQTAYDEHYLSEDGQVLGDFLARPKVGAVTRVAFFFHLLDLGARC
jgi:hypothetical protein